MTNNRTFPNVLWILVHLLLILFVATVAVFMIMAISKNKNFAILFPLMLDILVLMLLSIQLSKQFIFTAVGESGITLFQPLKFKKVTFGWNEIKGYSTSQIYYGNNLYKSKTFIVYSKTEEAFEVIKLFNFKFEQTLASLEQYPIQKLGSEPYQTGILNRKYKYIA